MNNTIVYDLNQLHSDSPVFWCMEIEIPEIDSVYITTDNDNVIFDGKTFIPFPCKISEVRHGSNGEVPEVTISLGNATRVMDTYLHQYDYYRKINGVEASDINVTLYVLNKVDLSEAILTEHLIFESAELDNQWAAFKLGAKSPFSYRYPKRRIMQNICDFQFKIDPRCGYTGEATSCDKTLARCRELGNSRYFGGFPGAGRGATL